MSAVFDVVREGGPGPSWPAPGSSCCSTPARSSPIRTAVGDGVLSGSGRVNGRAGLRLGAGRRLQGRLARRRAAARRSPARSTSADAARRAGRRLPALRRRAAAGGRRRAARLLARSSARRRSPTVPQISVIGGPCAGGAAYSPALGDLTSWPGPRRACSSPGPRVIEKVTRERITAMDLGGPKVHGKNGVAHLVADGDVAGGRARPLGARAPALEGRRRAAAVPAAGPGGGRPGGVLPSASARSTTCAT